MDDSEIEPTEQLKIFKYSPLKSKPQESKPNLRPCQIKYLKRAKTSSPIQTAYKTSSLPRVYEGS